MRYVIVGAGGIGGVVGGRLAEAGRDVVLVARGEHGAAIRRDGLVLATPEREARIRIPSVAAVGDLELAAEDVLLVAVKSQQFASVLADLAGLRIGDEPASERLPLFLLMNGVANEDAALRVFAHVHGVCVNLPATHLEPGRVVGEGTPVSGILALGRAEGGSDAADEAVAADLAACGFATDVQPDVMAFKRAKLLRNLGNAVDALCGSDLSPEESDVLDGLVSRFGDEGRRAFAAAGLSVVDDAAWDAHLGDRMRAVAVGGSPRQGGSTWQSVARGQGSVETDFLNGEVRRLGTLTGTPTPVNDLLQREMHRLVRDGAPAGSRRPSELLALLEA